ncbi:MAG: amino acid ABC transporter substrate-binding protein [Pseudomonadota bacterium]
MPFLQTRRLLSAAVLILSGASTAAADGVVERLRETGEIRMGVRRDAAPMSSVNADGGADGYTIRVCLSVADELEKQLGIDRLKPMLSAVDTANRFAALQEGRIDLLCGAATVTLARREQVAFSIPTFVDGASVLLPKAAPETFDALAGKRIGVRSQTTTEAALRNTLTRQGMDAEVVPIKDHRDALGALEAGEIDAYFADQTILVGIVDQSDDPTAFKIATETLTVEKHALAMPLGDEAFRLEVDRAISTLYRSGRMAEIFRDMFAGATPSTLLKALYRLAPELP